MARVKVEEGVEGEGLLFEPVSSVEGGEFAGGDDEGGGWLVFTDLRESG